LVRRLLAEGTSVRALARPSSRADALEKLGVEIVRGDLSNDGAILSAAEGAEIVYHAAAKVTGAGRRNEFVETNVGGTERVLRAARQQRARRVVYLSSIAVYGLVEPGERIDERTPFDAAPEKRDPYSYSKILADRMAMSFATQTGLPLTILREGVVYGPGRPLPLGLLGFRAGSTNFVFGNSKHRMPLNFVENLVDAILAVSQVPEGATDTPLRQYIVIDDDALTLAQYHSLRAGIDKSHTLFFPGAPVLASAAIADAARLGLSIGQRQGAAFSAYQVKRALQDRWYSSRRIREETGWSAKVPLHEAIARAATKST
jgi:dihydroflavonol-4-reductase